MKLVFFFLLMAGCIHTNAVEHLLPEALDIQRAEYEQGFRNENPELVIKHYDDDIRLMPEANPTVFSKKNVRLYFSAFFERFDIQDYKREPNDIVNMGSQIAEFGSFTLKIGNALGNDWHLGGKYLNLWARDTDGKFRIIVDTWNFDERNESFTQSLNFPDVPSVVTALGPQLQIDSPLLVELAAYSHYISSSVMNRDKQRISRVNSDDVILYPNYGETLRGIEEVNNYWNHHMDDLAIFSFLENRFDKVDHLGDYVIQYTSHIVSWRADEYSGVNTGKHVRIWKRNASGVLQCFRRISTYDQ